MKKRVLRALGVLLFLVGVAAGLAVLVAGTWADLEALFYGYMRMGDRSLTSLECPVLIVATETGTISATVRNPLQNEAPIRARADISGPGPAKVERRSVTLAPGKSGKVQWTVTKADVDLGYFVMVRVMAYPVYPIPLRESTCGIVVLDLPARSGNQVASLALAVAVVGMCLGIPLWESSFRPLGGRAREAAAAMRFLGVVLMVGVLGVMQGWWLLCVVCLVLSLFMVAGALFLVLNQ